MRIGIVADIHDAVTPLRSALALLRERGVDRVVTLGDAFDSYHPGEPAVEVAALLQEQDAIGVWGNHDVGLSHDVPETVRDGAAPALLAFGAGLQPQLVLEGCRFSHMEPWKDPRRLEDLWRFDGVPNTSEAARRCFESVPERILFVGHFHMWSTLDQDGPVVWDGFRPIKLTEPHRYLVLISAVANGWCAMFDSEKSELTPIRCSV